MGARVLKRKFIGVAAAFAVAAAALGLMPVLHADASYVKIFQLSKTDYLICHYTDSGQWTSCEHVSLKS